MNGRVAVALTLGGLVAGVAGCDRAASEEPPPADDSAEPGADTYATAIARVVDIPDEPPASTPEPLPVVYVVPIAASLSIEDQASVIDTFSASLDIRFVDALAAAVDADLPGRPPRDDAVVLGLGPIEPDPPHRLRVEQYHSAKDVEATLLTLAHVVDQWVVTTTETVPAEALTDAE